MRARLEIALIADDLTGALDSVVVFANAGLRCVVATSFDHLQAALDQQPDVIAVSTNSRDLSDAASASVVAAVGRAVAGVPVVIKKIDSRLKGNIAAEVAALAQVLGCDRALLCPAIPDMGRTVMNGFLQGHGVGSPLPVHDVLADVVGLSVETPDATTDGDIDAILAAVPADTLMIGARGLCAGLARRMKRLIPKPVALPLPTPIAFVIGSRDPITLAQVAHLRQSAPDAVFTAAPNGKAPGTPVAADVAILQATPSLDPAAPATVTQDLAKSCLRIFRESPASLVVTGGETAAAVLAAMGIGLLEVVGEALPGMPICRALGFGNGPFIVTKSGGFGATEALSLLAGGNSYVEALRVEQA